jgi:hypothetical protein
LRRSHRAIPALAHDRTHDHRPTDATVGRHAAIDSEAQRNDRTAGNSACLFHTSPSLSRTLSTTRPIRRTEPGRTWKGVRVSDSTSSYEGYCVKCKAKRHYTGEVRISESGRRMARGTYPVCGSTINRILGKA